MQSVIREAKKLNIEFNEKENIKELEIMKYILNIPLLPPHLVEDGYEFVEELVNQAFPEQKKWTRFLKLNVKKFWLLEITPEVFSVNEQNNRTNYNQILNFYESMHAKLGHDTDTFKLICKNTS